MDEKVIEKRKIQPMHIEPGFYPSIVDIVVATNDKVRKPIGAQKHEYNRIYVSVDKITQKIVIYLPEDQSVFIFQSADLSHIFWLCFGTKSDRGYNGRKRTT